MAEKKQTVRQRREQTAKKKPRRKLKQAGGKVKNPLQTALKAGQREFHFVKLPANRLGKILGKRVNLIPSYFRESWAEVRQVTWPGRKETFRLSVAVFIFSAIFSAIAAGLDFGLDKIFRELIIK